MIHYIVRNKEGYMNDNTETASNDPIDLAQEHELRQAALHALTDDNGVIRGSSDDVQKMMLQLDAQAQSERELESAEGVIS